MISRSVGAVLRGKGTPLQFMFACILGATLGFMPGVTQAPGLVLCLTLLLVLLNANLFLAVTVGLLAKAVAFVSMPVSFAVGRLALDGPTQPLFKRLVNAPVLAFFGFEYYAVTGGLLLGLVVGIIIGLLIVKTVGTFRRKMSTLEEGSDRYKQWTSKRWVRILLYIFAGAGHGKTTYAELLNKRVGNPIRPLGAAFVLLVVALLVIIKMLASGPLVAWALRSGLESANGATVDIQSTDVDLQQGRITITGLAMADPSALDSDLLRAARVEGQINTTNLLRKRIQLDRVLVSDATHGEKRQTPGRLIGPQREPRPKKPKKEKPQPGKTLDDYMKDAKVWKQRLAQARDWLEKLSGPEKAESDETTTTTTERPTEEQEVETLAEKLDRLVREHGHARVAASHLIEGAPTLLISELTAEKVRIPQFPTETLDIAAKNLSTHPGFASGAPQLVIKSSAGTFALDVSLNGVTATPTHNLIKLAYKGLSTDSFAASLATDAGGVPPVRGGTIDFSTEGRWSAGLVDLPLQVVLNNATFALPGAPPQPVKRMLLPIGIAGPLDHPRITIDKDQFSRALVDAGATQVADRARAEADKIKTQASAKLQEQSRSLLQNALGGTKEEPKKKR